jgi:hypothetical protein
MKLEFIELVLHCIHIDIIFPRFIQWQFWACATAHHLKKKQKKKKQKNTIG